MTKVEKKMLNELEAIRKSSEGHDRVIVAFGNGKEVIGIEENDGVARRWLRDNGYWIVNHFRNGQSLGLGF